MTKEQILNRPDAKVKTAEEVPLTLEDVPKAFRDDYVELEDGGIEIATAERVFLDAQKRADQRKREGFAENVDASDILQGEAMQYDALRDKLLKEVERDEAFVDMRYAYHLIEEQLKNNPDTLRDGALVRDLVSRIPFILGEASLELRNDKEIVLAAVKADGSVLRYASENLRSDREVVLVAAQTAGLEALRDTSNLEFRSDREIVLTAARNYPDALRLASSELQSDKELVLSVLKSGKWPNEGYSFEKSVPEDLRNDKEVALEAIMAGVSLAHIGEKMRDDEDIVITAVKLGDKFEVFYASKRLKNNKNVALAAVSFFEESEKRSGGPIDHLSDEMRQDKDVILASVQAGWKNILLSEELKDDKDFVLSLIKLGALPSFVSNMVSQGLLGDKEVGLALAKYYPGVLGWLSEDLRNSSEIVKAAVKLDAEAIRDASIKIQAMAKFKEAMAQVLTLLKKSS